MEESVYITGSGLEESSQSVRDRILVSCGESYPFSEPSMIIFYNELGYFIGKDMGDLNRSLVCLRTSPIRLENIRQKFKNKSEKEGQSN